jgi:hypothetical protein
MFYMMSRVKFLYTILKTFNPECNNYQFHWSLRETMCSCEYMSVRDDCTSTQVQRLGIESAISIPKSCKPGVLMVIHILASKDLDRDRSPKANVTKFM